MIIGPMTATNHPDRVVDCEMAIEQEFLALAERSGAAGWSATEVAEALLSLSFNHLRFRQDSAVDETRIAEARRRFSH